VLSVNTAKREGCACTLLCCSLVCQWLFLKVPPVCAKRAQLSACGATPGEDWMHWGYLASSGSTHCHLKGTQRHTWLLSGPDNTVLQMNFSPMYLEGRQPGCLVRHSSAYVVLMQVLLRMLTNTHGICVPKSECSRSTHLHCSQPGTAAAAVAVVAVVVGSSWLVAQASF